MHKLILLLIMTLSTFTSAVEKPQIKVKDVRIDNTLTNYLEGRIDETKGRQYEDWTVIILDLDIQIPDSFMNNRFEQGKWLDSMIVEWSFLYKPRNFKEHISNYMRFTRSVEYRNIAAGKKSVAIFIDPDTMKRYFDSGRSLKSILLSKIVIKHDGYLKAAKIFEGERETSELLHKKMFQSVKTQLVKNILKTRLETPFRSFQTEKFLELSQK